MFKHILVAFDGTPGSEQALKQAIALARLTGASLTALAVEEKLPAYAASVGEVEEAKREMDAYFAKIQAAAVEQARGAGVKLKTVVRAGRAAQAIVQFAEEDGFDLVVIGAGGQRSLGGTADKVAESALCAVLIARAQPLSMRVRDVMSPDVVTVGPATPLEQVVELLIQRRLKAVPVVENGQVVGIITGGDLVQRGGLGLRLSLQQRLPAEALAEQLRELAAQGKTAADVMTSPAITVRAEATVAEAARLIADKHVKRLPVIDAAGRLAGIISRLDVLTTAASVAQTSETLPALPAGLLRTAGDVLFRDVPTVGPDASLNEVLNKLMASPLRRVVVIDDSRRVLGIIVDADLLGRVNPTEAPGLFRALMARLAHTPAGAARMSGRAADVMMREVFKVRQDAPLAEVIQMMIDKRVKRLVVVDAAGRLVGMVDRQSLLRVITEAGLEQD